MENEILTEWPQFYTYHNGGSYYITYGDYYAGIDVDIFTPPRDTSLFTEPQTETYHQTMYVSTGFQDDIYLTTFLPGTTQNSIEI